MDRTSFKRQVLKDLEEIKRTPSGAAMLMDLEASGKKVKIEETSGGNACSGFDRGALKKSDGTNGSGSDSPVSYNPGKAKIGNKPWESRPPAIGLGMNWYMLRTRYAVKSI